MFSRRPRPSAACASVEAIVDQVRWKLKLDKKIYLAYDEWNQMYAPASLDQNMNTSTRWPTRWLWRVI